MEEIRLSKSGKATYILAVACPAFAGIGIQQIILSAGIYSWYHIPVLLGLSCMAARPVHPGGIANHQKRFDEKRPAAYAHLRAEKSGGRLSRGGAVL